MLKRLMDAFIRMALSVARLAEALLEDKPQGGLAGLHVSRVQGRSTSLKQIDRGSLDLVDIQKVLLSIAPKDAAGEPTPAEDWVWTSSDENVIVLETTDVQKDADGNDVTVTLPANQRSARTPHVGTSVVTVVRGDVTEFITLNVKAGEPEAANLSAGAPTLEPAA